MKSSTNWERREVFERSEFVAVCDFEGDGVVDTFVVVFDVEDVARIRGSEISKRIHDSEGLEIFRNFCFDDGVQYF